MNTQTHNDYLLLFRGTDWTKELSSAQLQEVVSDWAAWFERLTQEGKCKGGHPLQAEGKLVSGKQGHMVTDGPFAESKEAIGVISIFRSRTKPKPSLSHSNAQVSNTAASSR